MNEAFGEARVEWDGAGPPYSPRFDDVYFSRAGGVEETRHVFLGGNGLPDRWRGASRFCVGETGFGTGLNFLITWREWRETAPPGSLLHYVSVEKHPIPRDEVARILEPWHGLGAQARELVESYPLSLPGFHRIHLDGGRVFLTLLFGDVVETLGEMSSPDAGLVDAWYLDGFSPAKNPEMWTPEVFREIARISAKDATVATYSAAGAVRRGLDAAGFDVEKVPGFAGKREMLSGRLREEKPARADLEKAAIVIGAGLAGTSAAHALLRRGWQVTLIERHERVAEEASGNPRGILMPYPTAVDDDRDRFYCGAFEYARKHVTALNDRHASVAWRQCGVLQLVSDERATRRRDSMVKRGLPRGFIEFVDAAEASEHCGFPVQDPGLFFRHGGTLSPRELCRAHLNGDSQRLNQCFGTGALSLDRSERGWRVLGTDGAEIACAQNVIVATAKDTRDLLSPQLPLGSVRGQLTFVPATEASCRLRTVIHHDGYVLPAFGGDHCIGATFDRGDDNLEVETRDHDRNLAALHSAVPELFEAMSNPAPGSVDGRVAFRATTPDHLPLVGGWEPGLYVSAGHGSRGIVSAPLSAELVAARILEEPAPASNAVAEAATPVRYSRQQPGKAG